MITVWKYIIDLEQLEKRVDDAGGFNFSMPKGATISHVEMQHSWPCMWAVVDTEQPLETRRFALLGTGHKLSSGFQHVGSFQMLDGKFVGHVFEEQHETRMGSYSSTVL